jgi:hypothetical protein
VLIQICRDEPGAGLIQLPFSLPVTVVQIEHGKVSRATGWSVVNDNRILNEGQLQRSAKRTARAGLSE